MKEVEQMGENSRMFKRVTAFVLTLVMALSLVVASPATTAEAAKSYATKLTLTRSGKTVSSLSVTAGSSKSIQAKISAKGTVSKTVTAKTNRTSIATAKVVNKKYVKVTGKKAGKTYLTVTTKAKNAKGKVLSKKILVTVKAKAAAVKNTISVAEETATIAVGEKYEIKPVVTPANATVTYATSDDKVATVENGVVTAVAPGKADITLTNGDATATVAVTVEKVLLKSLKQTRANAFEAVITGKTDELKTADILITNTSNNVVYPVKAITVDKDDATKVTIETVSNITDKKEYTIEIGSVKMTFTATDDVVTKVGIDKTTVQAGVETEIKMLAKNADDVILAEYAYGDQPSDYDFTITVDTAANGYVAGSKLVLNNVGDTATAEITKHSRKYDPATGAEIENITSGKLVITAVKADEATVNGYKIRIGVDTLSFDELKDTDLRLAVGDTNRAAFLRITDSNGKEVADYSPYTIESSDKDALIVKKDSFDGMTKFAVEAVKIPANPAYIIIKNASTGEILNTVQVNIVEERKDAGLQLVNSADRSIVMSTCLDQADKDVAFKLVDQYGDERNIIGNVKVDVVSQPSNIAAITVDEYATASGNTVTFVSSDGTSQENAPGTYVFKVTYGDFQQNVTVTLKKPVVSGKPTYRFELSKTSADVKIDGAADTDETVEIRLGMYYNNILYQYVDFDDVATFEVTDSNKAPVTTNGAIDTVGVISLGQNKNDGSNKVATFQLTDASSVDPMTVAATGTYTLSVKSGDAIKVDQKFVVTDTQTEVVIKRVKDSISSGELTIANAATAAQDIVDNCFEFYYKGEKIESTVTVGANYVGDPNPGRYTNIKKVTLNVPVYEASGVKYYKQMTINVGMSVMVTN